MASKKFRYASLLSAILAFFGWLFSNKKNPVDIENKPNIFEIDSSNAGILQKGRWIVVGNGIDALKCQKKFNCDVAIIDGLNLQSAKIAAQFQISEMNEIFFYEKPKIYSKKGLRKFKENVNLNEIIDQYLYHSVKSIQKNMTEIPSFKELYKKLAFVIRAGVAEYFDLEI